MADSKSQIALQHLAVRYLPSAIRSLLLRFFEFTLDDIVAALAIAGAGAAGLAVRARAGLAVHRRANLLDDLIQIVRRALDRFQVFALQRLPDGGNLLLDAALHVAGDLIAALAQRLLGREDGGVRRVARLHLFLALLILRREAFGVFHHAVYLVLAQARRSGDRNMLGAPGRLVLRRDFEDAVGVNVKRHFNLRHAARRRRDAVEDEIAEQFIVGGHRALALHHFDLD